MVNYVFIYLFIYLFIDVNYVITHSELRLVDFRFPQTLSVVKSPCQVTWFSVSYADVKAFSFMWASVRIN